MSEIIEMKNNLPSINFEEHLKNFHSYVQKDKSSNSRRSYAFGWKKFEGWLSENGYHLKNNSDHIALHVGMFISDMAKKGSLKYTTLVSYLAAIKYYVFETMNIKLDHHAIQRALKGVRNDLKHVPLKKKGIKSDHISMMLDDFSTHKLIDVRDKAILLLGFSGAFRRSELVGIDFEHISFDFDGISIRIPFSKTDQQGKGHHVEIPNRNSIHNCPIMALKNWIKSSGNISGPIFKPITKSGEMINQRLSSKAVSLILKKRTSDLFENSDEISGHSLRRGFVLTAMERDVPALVIMNQTRHASVNTLKEYASEKKNYKTNALNSITF